MREVTQQLMMRDDKNGLSGDSGAKRSRGAPTLVALVAILTLLIASSLTACADHPTAPSGSNTLQIGASTQSSDPVTLDSASIVGDNLTLHVAFAGGCNSHDFTLVGGNVFMESLPVQTGVELSRHANGDQCRAMIQPALVFDVAPLKRVYRAQYNTEHGVVVLHVGVAGRAEHPGIAVRYEF